MSSDARSVLRNSVASIGGQLANLAVGLLSSIYVARCLGTAQYGMLSWAMGLASIVIAVANAGIDNIIVREVAINKKQAADYLMSAFVVKVISAATCCLGIAFYIHARGYSGIQLAVGYILCSTVISESFNYSCRAVLAALERQDTSAIASVITNVVRVAVVITLVHAGFNVVAVAWATLGGTIAILAAHLVIIRRLTGRFGRPQLGRSKYLVVVGATFLASQIPAGIFDRADYVMLDWFKGVDQVGIYSAAYRIIEIVTMVAYNSSFALFPIISKRRATGTEEELARAIERSTKYLTIIGIPFCTVVYLLSHQIMMGLFSVKFAGSGACLAILIWGRVATFAILPGQQAVQARNAQLWLVPPVIARCIVNISLNLYLIPHYGAIGASISMVITENIYFSLIYLFAFRGPERFNPVKLLAKPVLAAGIMAIVVWVLRPYGIAVASLGAMTAYTFALLQLKALDSEDKRIIGSVLAGVRNRVGV